MHGMMADSGKKSEYKWSTTKDLFREPIVLKLYLKPLQYRCLWSGRDGGGRVGWPQLQGQCQRRCHLSGRSTHQDKVPHSTGCPIIPSRSRWYYHVCKPMDTLYIVPATLELIHQNQNQKFNSSLIEKHIEIWNNLGIACWAISSARSFWAGNL